MTAAEMEGGKEGEREGEGGVEIHFRAKREHLKTVSRTLARKARTASGLGSRICAEFSRQENEEAFRPGVQQQALLQLGFGGGNSAI